MTKIQSLLRHIQLVRDLGIIVGERYIELGDESFGRHLIQNVLIHDNSKFEGIEWEAFFNGKKDLIPAAIEHHNHTNKHHPQYWHNGIFGMPKLYIAEMSLDWIARSQDNFKDPTEWIEKEAMSRFGFSVQDQVYADIMMFIEMAKKDIN